jgi:hypothetical protein
MTLKAGYAVIRIATHALMFAIHVSLIVFVAINTWEKFIVASISMAFVAIIPLSFVLTGIDWKILSIMIKCRWFPCCFRVTIGTSSWELCCCMRRVIRLAEIATMAVITSSWYCW